VGATVELARQRRGEAQRSGPLAGCLAPTTAVRRVSDCAMPYNSSYTSAFVDACANAMLQSRRKRPMNDIIIYMLGMLALASAGAFALGSSWNLKRGHDALRWLRSALPALGERTTMEWLGTSVVKLSIAKAHNPFRAIEILVVMEPRDVPPFWLHGHLNGRRDTLILRGQLRQPPA